MGIRRSGLRLLRVQHEVHRGQAGLSILEVLITTVLTSVGFTALLQFLLFAVWMEARSEQFWDGTIEKWNRSQELRSSQFQCEAEGEEVLLGEVGSDLRKIEIEGDEEDVQRRWEILFTCREGLYTD